VQEISSIARILARYHSVTVTKQDAEEYINVIIQENMKMNAESVDEAQPQDIQNYLEKLREQKK